MKSKILPISILTTIFLCFLLNPNSSLSQTSNDSLIKIIKGNTFLIGENTYSKSEIIEILKSNTITTDILNTSSSQKTWGYISLSAGLCLTAGVLYQTWESYNNYGVSDKSNGLIIQSVLAIGLDIAGIFLLLDSKSSFNKAIRTHNKIQTSKKNPVSINIGFNNIIFTLNL